MLGTMTQSGTKSPRKAASAIKASSTVHSNQHPDMESSYINISDVERALMSCLANLHRLGVSGPIQLVLVARECGYKNIESRGFRAARIKLRNAGLIQMTSSTAQLTNAGVVSLPVDLRPPPETRHVERISSFREPAASSSQGR